MVIKNCNIVFFCRADKTLHGIKKMPYRLILIQRNLVASRIYPELL